MKRHMVCLTLAFSMMIGGLTTCGSADPGTTGVSVAPASSTVPTAKGAGFQDTAWPEGPVQIIMGTSVGGGVDTAARLTGKCMGKYVGRSFVVTNTAGGAGSIAANDVKNAKMDGCTFLVAHETILTNRIAGVTGFDRDVFACVDVLFQVYNTYLLSKKYASVPEPADAVKTSPDIIKFGARLATNDTAIIAMMGDSFGISFQLVDAGAISDRIVLMMGDHIDFIKTPVGLTKDHVASGDFHILAFFSQEHNPGYPDVLITREEGVDFVVDKFFDYSLPRDTDPVVIEKFPSALEQICQDPDFQKEAADVMYGVDHIAPADMPAYSKNCKIRLVGYQDLLEEHYNK